MRLGPVLTAAARTAGLAWCALVQAIADPGPAPAWRWRSAWQRQAAYWGLAVAVAAAGMASLVSVPGVWPFYAFEPGPRGSAPRPTGAGSGVMAQPAPAGGAVLAIVVALAVVVPLLLVIRRPLLGWRIAWLALLAVPWAGIGWLPGGGWVLADWPWDPVQVVVLAVVFAAAGVRHSRGALWWMWALTLLPWWLRAGQARPGMTTLAIGTVLFTALAVAADSLGYRLRSRLALAEAAERAEAEAGRRAVLEERARIARELHDVVAHHMSLVAVRAESAPYRLTRLADDARTEFGELSSTARKALIDMQRLLGVLRTGEAPAHTPQPQLGDLPGLIDAARHAGLPVQLSRQGRLDGASTAVGACAYRIVQESLSNAGRHAPGAAVSVGVEVEVEPPVVRLMIKNGPPAEAGHRPAAVTGPRTVNGHSHGHGLAGMRERVTLLGGTFSAGPVPGGGFEVAAELPTGELA